MFERSPFSWVRRKRLVIFILVQLPPRSPISSSATRTSPVWEGETNRSMVRSKHLAGEALILLPCRHRESSRHSRRDANRHFISFCAAVNGVCVCVCVCVMFRITIQNCRRGNPYLRIGDNTQHYSVQQQKIAARQLQPCPSSPGGAGENKSSEGGKVSAREKRPWEGKTTSKDWMWAGGSKHAGWTYSEIYSVHLSRQSRWKWDFSSLKEISDNWQTSWEIYSRGRSDFRQSWYLGLG